jgi:hypothetical protein
MMDKNPKTPQVSGNPEFFIELKAERDWLAQELDAANSVIYGLVMEVQAQAPHINLAGFDGLLEHLETHLHHEQRVPVVMASASRRKQAGHSPKTTPNGDYDSDNLRDMDA